MNIFSLFSGIFLIIFHLGQVAEYVHCHDDHDEDKADLHTCIICESKISEKQAVLPPDLMSLQRIQYLGTYGAFSSLQDVFINFVSTSISPRAPPTLSALPS